MLLGFLILIIEVQLGDLLLLDVRHLVLEELRLLLLHQVLANILVVDFLELASVLAIQNDCILVVQVPVRIVLDHDTRLTELSL
jgi:hypothetical protein